MTGAFHPILRKDVRQYPGPDFEPARAKFRDLLFVRIIAFEEFRKSADRQAETADALVKIADLAHKISGTAATLGFNLAGDLAFAVEKAVLSGRARQIDATAIWSEVEPRLDAMLDALEALLDD